MYWLDTPGSYLRGALAGRMGERASGRQLLEAWNLLRPEDQGLGASAAGMATEMAVDPLNLLGPAMKALGLAGAGLGLGMALSKAGKAGRVTRLYKSAIPTLADLSQAEVAAHRSMPLFEALSYAQRGKPEDAMLALQMSDLAQLHGYMAEHIGDLTHRMSESIPFMRGGYGPVKEKVDRGLRFLLSGNRGIMPFDEDVAQQVANNVQYLTEHGRPITESQAWDKIKSLSSSYANEHAKLPVFNQAQEIAQQAAISIGNMKYGDAADYLQDLSLMLDAGPDEWSRHAMSLGKLTDETYDRSLRQAAQSLLGEDTWKRILSKRQA